MSSHKTKWRCIYTINNGMPFACYFLDSTGRLNNPFQKQKPRNLQKLIQELHKRRILNSTDNSRKLSEINPLNNNQNNDLNLYNFLNDINYSNISFDNSGNIVNNTSGENQAVQKDYSKKLPLLPFPEDVSPQQPSFTLPLSPPKRLIPEFHFVSLEVSIVQQDQTNPQKQ